MKFLLSIMLLVTSISSFASDKLLMTDGYMCSFEQWVPSEYPAGADVAQVSSGDFANDSLVSFKENRKKLEAAVEARITTEIIKNCKTVDFQIVKKKVRSYNMGTGTYRDGIVKDGNEADFYSACGSAVYICGKKI